MVFVTTLILHGVILLCLWPGLKKPIHFFSLGYALSVLCQSVCLLLLYRECFSYDLTLLHALLFIGYGLRLLFYIVLHSFRVAVNAVEKERTQYALSVPRAALVMCVCSVVLFCMVSPLFSAILATANGDPTNGVTQCIGLFFMALGLGVESVADWQKNHYKRPHPELYCSKGLFAYMRMPNYLGEILFWIGNLVTTFAFPRCTFLLVCNTIGSFFSISVMIYAAFDLDAKQLRYSATDPEYIAYRRRTYVFYPLPSS